MKDIQKDRKAIDILLDAIKLVDNPNHRDLLYKALDQYLDELKERIK